MISVKILDNIHDFDSSPEGADGIIESISNIVENTGLIIDSMDFDDIRVYSDYEGYIRENCANLGSITVNLITKDEFIDYVISTTHEYIQNSLPRIQPIIDSLYTGEKSAEVIEDLAGLTEGIAWIYTVGKEVIAMSTESEHLKAILKMGYSDDIQRLEDAFFELKNGIMNMDYVLIADILNYEILDIFNAISAVLQGTNKK